MEKEGEEFTERVDETVRSAAVSREASTSDVGPVSSGAATGSEFLAFMRYFNSMVTVSGNCLNKTQLVSNIQPYRHGNDIVMYIKALEADMIRIGVRKKEWLSVLLSKLSSKAKMSVASVSFEPDCTYQDVKAKLLDGVGMDLKVIETSLFSEWKSLSREWDMVTRFEKMKAPLYRFVLGDKTVDELSLRLAKAIYKLRNSVWLQLACDHLGRDQKAM